MKKTILSAVLLLLMAIIAQAQNYGHENEASSGGIGGRRRNALMFSGF